jgi:hypothetical protein
MTDHFITKLDFVPLLRERVPRFHIEELWAADQLGYVIANDFARYICNQAQEFNFAEVETCLRFLESLIAKGDSYVRELVEEAMETLEYCDSFEEIESRFTVTIAGLRTKRRTKGSA